MSLIFDTTLDVHTKALKLREQRATLLANNLTNASTPHYKAVDFDFAKAFKNEMPNSLPLAKTDGGRDIQSLNASSNVELKYQAPTQSSLDGNTVDVDVEREKFVNNTIQYQATLSFIKSHFKNLMTAMQGD